MPKGKFLKVFISLPMRDRTEKEIQKEFERVKYITQKKFPNRWVKILPSYTNIDPPEEVKDPGVWYVGRSILKLAEAEVVVFARGWETSRGCLVEHSCANEYGMTILELTDEDYN